MLPSEQLLSEINELRKRNEELEKQTSSSLKIKNIARLDEKVNLSGIRKEPVGNEQEWKITTTWGELFSMLSPYLLTNPSDDTVKSYMNKFAKEYLKIDLSYVTVSVYDWVYQTIKVQFMALGLVNVVYAQSTGGPYLLFWNITAQGKEKMFALRSIKTSKKIETTAEINHSAREGR